MKPWVGVGLGLVFLTVVGCAQKAAEPTVTPTPVTSSAAASANSAPQPDFTGSQSSLAIIGDKDQQVKVQDSIAAFDLAFPRDAKQATSLEELPEGFAPDQFSVRGWEFENFARGAGAILHEGKIAVAMQQLESLNQKSVDDIVNQYQGTFGRPRIIDGDKVHYRFWQTEHVTLMLCACEVMPGKINLTIAVGDSGDMSYLGMSSEIAGRDLRAIEPGLFQSNKVPANVSSPG